MNIRRSAAAASATLLLAWPVQSRAQNTNGALPVLDPPAHVVSLHRPHEEWKVITSITLAVEPTPGREVTLRWTQPKFGALACNGLADTVREAKLAAGVSSIVCSYQPAVGPESSDSFAYQAAFTGSAFGDAALVTIEIRERGLRWEFKTTGSTITSDAPDPKALAQVPSILGSTDQDFLFNVNWQTMRPRRRLTEPGRARAPGLLSRSDLKLSDNLASRSANFLIETGVQSETVAATVTDIGSSATTASSSGEGTGTTSEQSVSRRNLILRGELNYNASFNADGAGRFIEVGGLGRGGVSTVMDSNESFREALGRVPQVVPMDRTSYRMDSGVRFVIKQAHETNRTVVVDPDGQVEPPTNIENYFLAELTLRFDSALSGLPTDAPDGDSRNRWAFRAEFSPEMTFLPGHQLPTVGVEVSGAWNGGPPSVKVNYGVNLSATKGILKK